jgi:hypothetical protein
MALSASEIIQVMEKFKELGLTSFKAEGIEMTNAVQATAPSAQLQKPKAEPIPEDIKPEQIINPLSVFDEMDEEMMTYYATPYYDELLAKREAMKAAKDSGTNEIPGK